MGVCPIPITVWIVCPRGASPAENDCEEILGAGVLGRVCYQCWVCSPGRIIMLRGGGYGYVNSLMALAMVCAQNFLS